MLTGEDAQYFEALSDGADGGILASAHVETATFAEICKLVAAGERDAALARWQSVADLTRLLFAEPSPAPIKHWLWRTGLIDSAEVRLPMTEVSAELAARIDRGDRAAAARHQPCRLAMSCQRPDCSLAFLGDALVRTRALAQRRAQSSFVRASRSALPITLTEDSAIAAAPTIGDSRMPNTG